MSTAKERLTSNEGYIRLIGQHATVENYVIGSVPKVQHGNQRAFRKSPENLKLGDSFYGGVEIRIRVDKPVMNIETLEEASIVLTLDQAEKLIERLQQDIDSVRKAQSAHEQHLRS